LTNSQNSFTGTLSSKLAIVIIKDPMTPHGLHYSTVTTVWNINVTRINVPCSLGWRLVVTESDTELANCHFCTRAVSHM